MADLLTTAGLAVGLIALLLGAAELGYRVGSRRQKHEESVVSQASVWEAAMLALLGLLLSFTFAMAVTRFDNRRELISEEANAIEQTVLRAGFAEPATRRELETLLRRYVEARIRFYDARLDQDRTEVAQREAVGLQRAMWSQVLAVARANPGSEMAALLVESANDLIVLGARRRAAIDNHVPGTIMVLLLLVAGCGLAATGYSCGLRHRRLAFGMNILPILIGAVILLVLDVDHPRGGLVRAGQGPMLRLRDRISVQVLGSSGSEGE